MTITLLSSTLYIVANPLLTGTGSERLRRRPPNPVLDQNMTDSGLAGDERSSNTLICFCAALFLPFFCSSGCFFHSFFQRQGHWLRSVSYTLLEKPAQTCICCVLDAGVPVKPAPDQLELHAGLWLNKDGSSRVLVKGVVLFRTMSCV